MYFDTLLGVDKEVLKIINFRIEEVKMRANVRIAELIEQLEQLEKKMHAYKVVDPAARGILQYPVHVIMKSMPLIFPDPWELWELLLQTFGSEVFTPMIVAKFPMQFSEDQDQKRIFLRK